MDCRFVALVGLVLMWLPFVPLSVAVGDEPDASQLLRSVPVLSPNNESLDSFSFVGEFVTPFGVPAVFEACWAREEGFGFGLVDQFGLPVLFIAQKQMMLYDASDGFVTLGGDCNPNVIMQIKERRAVASCGIESSENARFIVDIPSFVPDGAHVVRTLRQLPNKLWELKYVNPRGSELLLLFNDSERWPLTRMEASANGNLMVIVREIVINRPVPLHLMTFPSVDAFPADVVTERLGDRAPDSFGDVLSLPQRFVRALAAPSAIRDSKLRSFPFSKDVNWGEVERHHKMTGPKLSSLLDFEIKGRTLK